MIDSKQLAAMSDIEITEIDRALLINIDNVQIDASLPADRKIESYIQQVKNPYCFLCDETPVRVRFVSNKKTLEQSLSDYFISLK